ncbi:hypothetical protein ACQPZJ_17025 [Actinoplanes sp. CA-054009]
MTCSTLLVAAADHWQSWPLGIFAAAVAGTGLGIGLVSGLLEIQRIASPTDLAALTGVFYAVAYSGFLASALISAVAAHSPLPVGGLLLSVVALQTLCGLRLLHSCRRSCTPTPAPTHPR